LAGPGGQHLILPGDLDRRFTGPVAVWLPEGVRVDDARIEHDGERHGLERISHVLPQYVANDR